MRQDTGVDGDAQRISQLCWMFFLKIIDDQDQELDLLHADYRSPIQKKYQWRTGAADPEGMDDIERGVQRRWSVRLRPLADVLGVRVDEIVAMDDNCVWLK